jgi:AcrR family transcriptional regulator
MTKESISSKIATLVSVATRLFIEKGYRRTQMEDVTKAMGLSPAAVYRYVESKEALFDLVVRAGAMPGQPPGDLKLPVPTPRAGTTMRFLRQTFEREGRIQSLEAALKRNSVDDPKQELEEIIRELYKRVARFHIGMKLLDRSALDWPQLAGLWSGQLRSTLVEHLATYIRHRSDRGLLRPVPSPRAAARLIIETVAFFAMHRHYDPFPTTMDDKTAEDTVADTLVHAYLNIRGAHHDDSRR